MSTDASTEPPITGDKGTNGTHNQVLESEAANVEPVGKAEDRATKARGGNPDSPVPSDGIHLLSEALHDESQYSQAPNTSPPAPDSQEAHDDPGSGGRQFHNAPSRVDDSASADNEDTTRTAQDRTHRWQTQQLTGWAAVEKTLTDFDQQEVSGYKEDIDSLLTFAGLYSGVLTAFVIVSFTQLQEDTASETLKVLRIIANQTAGNAVPNQPVTAATTLAATAPFQPSLTAKRVNVLWFASLIISLSTASLAILVKQWLRAYIAFASSSPQGQLRIRHFRRSGLETWRVFGIASMLPLLLQISLALFFVGLCFFTTDIDPVIGFTTLPLVCAWAFLFITVTLAPAFSARCPYKTPALSTVTTIIRTRVWFLLRYLLAITISFVIAYPCHTLRHKLLGYDSRGLYRFTDYFKYTMRPERKVHGEEADMLNDPSKDLAILASADAIQANSELDLAIVEDVLKQCRPDYREALKFLIHIIGNRTPLPSQSADGSQAGLINCRLLSTRTKAGIKDFLSQYVIDSNEFKLDSEATKNRTKETGDYLGWDSFSPSQQWTILLAAWFDHTIQDGETVNRSIRDGGTVAMFISLCLWINLGYTARSLPQSLHEIGAILSRMPYDLKLPNARCNVENRQGHLSISKTLGSLTSTAARNFGNVIFSDYWKNGTEVGDSEDRCDAVLALCRIAEYMPVGDVGLYKEVFTPFVKESFLQRSYTMVEGILRSLFGLPSSSDESWHRPRRTSNCLFLLEIAAESQSSEAAYTHIVNALCIIADYSSVDSDTAEDFLHFCATALQFLKFEPHEPGILPDRNLWRRLFLLLIRYWHQMRKSLEQGFSCSLCVGEQKYLSDLVSIGEVVDDLLSARQEESLELSAEQRRTSPIPDIFCLALGTLVEEEGKPPIWTAKHLRNISPQDRMEIIVEGKVEMESALQAVRELHKRSAKDAQMGTPSAEGGSSEPHPTEAGPSGVPGAPFSVTSQADLRFCRENEADDGAGDASTVSRAFPGRRWSA